MYATLPDQRKLRNLRRDPRFALSVQSDRINEWGLREYLVVEGTARITEGGAADLLQRLAYTYLGPDVVFPNMPNPPPGYVTRIRVERVRSCATSLRRAAGGDGGRAPLERDFLAVLGHVRAYVHLVIDPLCEGLGRVGIAVNDEHRLGPPIGSRTITEVRQPGLQLVLVGVS